MREEPESPRHQRVHDRRSNTESATVIAAAQAACTESDRIIRACSDLSTPAANPGETRPPSMRRITIHMIEETTRHAGHADILREQLDGTTGL